MDSKTLALLCREYADNKKAENIAVLDMAEISSITDYFVIASGTTEPHLRAISTRLRTSCKRSTTCPRAMDGSLQTAWIVLDYFDVIVHVMRTRICANATIWKAYGAMPKRSNHDAPRRGNQVRCEDRTRRSSASPGRYSVRPGRNF